MASSSIFTLNDDIRVVSAYSSAIIGRNHGSSGAILTKLVVNLTKSIRMYVCIKRTVLFLELQSFSRLGFSIIFGEM
jgi:hypothetical protein